MSDSVEYPFVLFANFSKSYFDLPEFLIKSVMTEKQEYFCFMNKARLSNNFAFVSSKNDSNSKLIVKGNQNVLKARFSDAKFFIAEDKKKTLKESLKILKKVIFFTNAGTLHQRALRIKKLNIFISKQINFNIRKFEKFLALSNADLTSELVKEFPGLQGKVGGYYASLEKIPNEVCEAFYNQYNSKFPKKSNNILALIISISQKIDGILAFFISQKRISGAGDPFGLRRSVLSIIKICIDNKLSLDINLVIKFSLKTFEEQKNKK